MKSIRRFLLFCTFLTLSETALRFTNIKCDVFREDFATFPRCELKVMGRGVISLNIHLKWLQLPINVSLHKKLSGYRPFLYNYTVDFCNFMQNRRRYPFVKLVYDSLRKDSNINHTCPYDHDLIVDNLILEEVMFEYLPLPRGEYMFQVKVFVHNDLKTEVKAYIAVTSDLL